MFKTRLAHRSDNDDTLGVDGGGLSPVEGGPTGSDGCTRHRRIEKPQFPRKTRVLTVRKGWGWGWENAWWGIMGDIDERLAPGLGAFKRAIAIKRSNGHASIRPMNTWFYPVFDLIDEISRFFIIREFTHWRLRMFTSRVTVAFVLYYNKGDVLQR